MHRLKGEGFARCARLQGGKEGKGRERKDPGLCQKLEETGSRLVPWLRVGMWVMKIVPILPCSQGLRDCGTALDNGVDR